MPGRTTLATIAARVDYMRGSRTSWARPMPTVGVIPPTSIDETHDGAMEGMNVEGLLDLGQRARQVVGEAAVRSLRDGGGHPRAR